MSTRNPLPWHLQFLPEPEFNNFGSRKYSTFAAMRGELAFLLGVKEDAIREIDNSDQEGADDQLAIGGKMIGSFWRCPFEMPTPALMQAAE